ITESSESCCCLQENYWTALPNFLIIILWSSLIEYAAMLCHNFDKIKGSVLSLDPADTSIISNAQEYLLPEKIHNFQTELFCAHGLKGKKWDIFTSVREQLDGFAKAKLESCLQKNPDVEEFAKSVELSFQVNTKFAPLVSVDVE
ncbi:hypothetical protein L9F63_024064, partial [Diploptera punctata]